jgi:hypothetical protein
MEDMDQPAPDDCTCDHEGSGLDEDGCEIWPDEYDGMEDPSNGTSA